MIGNRFILSTFTNEHFQDYFTSNIMPLLATVIVGYTILSTFFVIRLTTIPVSKDDRLPRRQPNEAVFHCLIIRPKPHSSATIVVATSGVQQVSFCNGYVYMKCMNCRAHLRLRYLGSSSETKLILTSIVTSVFIIVLSDFKKWGRDNIDAISKTTFSNAFSRTKMLEFQLEFHWNLFLRV